MPEVRVIDVDGTQLGVLSTRKAIEMAREKELDLVEVSPNASPPVCKILDYGKYSYEVQKKMRDSRKRAARSILKEVQLRPKIGKHDYDFKMRNATRFLKAGDKVRIVMRFRGRENAHPEVGEDLLKKVAEDLKEHGVVDQFPRREGRIMIMVLSPTAETSRKAREGREASADKAADKAKELREGTDKKMDDIKDYDEIEEDIDEEDDEKDDDIVEDDDLDEDEDDDDDDDETEEEEDV